MTILASCTAALLVALIGATLYLPRWNASHQQFPPAGMWVVASAMTLVLAMLCAFALLVAIGGCVALYRDRCEERGIPYAPIRPRERIHGPMLLSILRCLFPRARLRPGELVQVRSLPEILATLDAKGCLEGLPFMPEMAAYCGHRYPVMRRVDKIWEYVHLSGMRRVRNAVLLKTLRCDGRSHGGCQAACQLIWKEAWLKQPGPDVPDARGIAHRPDLSRLAHATVDGKSRYFCQMTEIMQASTRVGPRDVGHYWRDLVGGNIRLIPLLMEISIRVFNGTQWRLGRTMWPVFQPGRSESSPHQDLGLQPGQIVRVRSKHEIEPTLNRRFRNRGLEFGKDQLFYSGGSYRVVARINQIVHEGTGEMLRFEIPSILLEGVNEIGGSILNPQNQFYFWREIWLEPQSPTAVSADNHHRSS